MESNSLKDRGFPSYPHIREVPEGCIWKAGLNNKTRADDGASAPAQEANC